MKTSLYWHLLWRKSNSIEQTCPLKGFYKKTTNLLGNGYDSFFFYASKNKLPKIRKTFSNARGGGGGNRIAAIKFLTGNSNKENAFTIIKDIKKIFKRKTNIVLTYFFNFTEFECCTSKYSVRCFINEEWKVKEAFELLVCI